MQAHSREDALPARHWARADYGVRRGEGVADVVGGAARGHDFVGARVGGGLEDGLGAGRG